MSSFLLKDGDLDYDSGNLALVTSNAAVTAAKLTALFSMFQGEWFRDGRLGFPYFTYVYVKNPNLSTISSLITQVCQECPGVSTVNYVNIDFNTSARKISVDVSVTTNDGVVLVGGLGKPFIVTARGQ